MIKKKAILLSYDFGGGNNLHLFSKKILKNYSKKYCFLGPSNKIIRKKENNKFDNLNFKTCKEVYYSLSWKKSLEKKIYKEKKKYSFETFLVLDGWGDYKKKILFNNKNNYPDNIICLDKYSYHLAKKLMLNKNSNLILYTNLLFKNLLNIAKFKEIKKNKILYLISPLINKKKIVMIKDYIYKNYKGNLSIRYHPKSISTKYKPLIKELLNYNLVIGHYSTSLIYSSLMGIKTLSINHTKIDIFKWKKLGVFSNFNIKVVKNKKLNSAFKKIKIEYI